MVQYVITPWRHQSELIEVREKLYGNAKDVEAMRGAVEVVGVWSEFNFHLHSCFLPFYVTMLASTSKGVERQDGLRGGSNTPLSTWKMINESLSFVLAL
jgi:hypothetical protein